jgi:hypothetical protein
MALPKRIMGLPTEGAMGENPALTVGGIISVCAILVAALGAFFGWQMPLEWRDFFDEYGLQLATALIVVIPMVQAAITRMHVFSPKTTAGMLQAQRAGALPPENRG